MKLGKENDFNVQLLYTSAKYFYINFLFLNVISQTLLFLGPKEFLIIEHSSHKFLICQGINLTLNDQD